VGLLVVNAGANTYGHEFVTGDLAAFRTVLTLNIDRKLEITHLFGGPMRERRRGGIILLGSVTGFAGCTHMSVYSGAKAFSRVFSEGLWLEMREHDVDVSIRFSERQRYRRSEPVSVPGDGRVQSQRYS